MPIYILLRACRKDCCKAHGLLNTTQSIPGPVLVLRAFPGPHLPLRNAGLTRDVVNSFHKETTNGEGILHDMRLSEPQSPGTRVL